MSNTSSRFLMSAAAAALCLSAVGAHAQTAPQAWPQRPIRVVVAFPPGTPGDVTMRTVADKVGTALGQPLVIENRPGAAGNIGAESVVTAPPDGYTVLEGPDTIFTINPLVYGKLNFRPDAFQPLTTLATFSQMLVCHPNVGVKSVTELTQAARARKLNYASGGVGAPGHLVMEMYLAAVDVTMTHIPYKGPAPAAQDLLAGQVDCAFLVTNVVAPHVKSGKLVGLAMSGQRRSQLVPQVPAMQEAGVRNFDATFSEMLFVPKGTRDDIQRKLQSEIAKALRSPDVREKLLQADIEPVGDTPEDAARRIRQESERWAPVVNRIGLKLD